MKTQYIKPEIHMVFLENMLMASNSISWTVNEANNDTDHDGNDHGHILYARHELILMGASP